MSKRLLIALPVAAVVVIALFWTMREFVPVGRPWADYSVGLPQHKMDRRLLAYRETPRQITICDCSEPPPPPAAQPPEPIERQPMPRERFPPPEREEPDNVLERQGVHSHCYRHRTGPLEFPDGAREGDRVTVEFTILSDGRVTDVRVIQSSNPAINDAVVEMVRRWRWKMPGFCGRQVTVKEKPGTVRTEIEFRKPEDG